MKDEEQKAETIYHYILSKAGYIYEYENLLPLINFLCDKIAVKFWLEFRYSMVHINLISNNRNYEFIQEIVIHPIFGERFMIEKKEQRK